MKKHQTKGHKIKEILPGSIAEELELAPGDVLLGINGEELEDVFDYQFLIQDTALLVLVEKKDGELWELEIEKDMEEDLGLVFENGLMDEYRSCRNRCIFCFIDQMPKGMRETLYFKDDDSRLSFLQGNYITLTNMSEKDLDRIIRFHLAPVNISFHTTNPQLRCKMLNNRFAGEALQKVDRLFEAGIEMNGQIVLCKGINDREELCRSLKDLERYIPCLQSVSVVPVGLTRYREGLYPLEPFEKEDAKEVLALIHQVQEEAMAKYGRHFVHASDEWYLLAEEPLPEEERYDGYLQLENGVGMLRLFINQVRQALKERSADTEEREVSLATGLLAAPVLRQLCKEIQGKFPGLLVRVYPVRNFFFGERITVSGLLTGQDLLTQLRDRPLGRRLLLPCNMLRSGERVFLDDKTVEDLERELSIPVYITEQSGEDFLKGLLDF
jgi:putative radical SAM enzyme (TIGR03279 family)